MEEQIISKKEKVSMRRYDSNRLSSQEFWLKKNKKK